MYGVKSEFSDLCRGCLSTDRKLSPLTNYDLYFSLLNKHPSEALEYYNILLCWECKARLRSTEVFQKRLRDAQCILSLAYNKITHEPLSPLKFIHKQDYDYSLQETIDTKPDFTFIDNCDLLDIKQELDFDNFDNEVLNYRESEVKEEEREIKKQRNRAKRIGKEKQCLKKIDNGIDFKNLELYFIKVNLSETEVQESVAMERNDNDCISRPLKCTVCGFRFANKTSLYWHKRENHRERSIAVKCPLCPSEYSYRADLLLHWRRLHPVNRCSFCRLVIERDEDREKHLRKHTFRYHCLKCGVDFLDRLTFRHHEKHLHTKYECAHCQFMSSKKKILETHMRNHHLPNRCAHCELVFPRRRDLARHQEAHLPPSKEVAYCVECDITFASRQRYSRHLSQTKKHAPGLKRKISVPCPECGKMFSRKTYMKNHVRLFHSNDSKHHCPICNKCFVNGFALRQHNKYVHEKKPVPKTKMCSVCGRSFGSNRILENHMRTHTGERPFACDRCASAFAQRVALKAHLAAVHKEK